MNTQAMIEQIKTKFNQTHVVTVKELNIILAYMHALEDKVKKLERRNEQLEAQQREVGNGNA
jgi:tetrahydromethanopterin S-methyltransferase subunit B